MNEPVTAFDEMVLKAFPSTFSSLKEQGILTPIVTFGEMKASLNAKQWAVFEQIRNLQPRDYDVKTPYAGDLEPVPKDLVTITSQQYTEKGEQKVLGEQYVPRLTFEAYTRMHKQFMRKYSGRKLLVASCYRSPAYQIVVFIHWLMKGYHGDIAQTIRHVSPPNYSQHTFASRVAIDFLNVDGSPSSDHPEDFKDTVEYDWLRQHANIFSFYESWQEGNEFGMRAEPWHWQFRG